MQQCFFQIVQSKQGFSNSFSFRYEAINLQLFKVQLKSRPLNVKWLPKLKGPGHSEREYSSEQLSAM
ncbi:hypothetical protein EYF80_017852 [Liparis tanakae]|uniref:Uncharacterized protein n=1 Tax=Liparis tanakae TaxID=230148 RepID=A0A4Z2I2Z3_9TELE|nr:hypothetical protein EYF80_017852 [Liparis tanakae]